MLLLAALALAPSSFQMNYSNSNGLSVSVDGIPLVDSSGFQFYAPGWKKGYCSSNSDPVTVDRKNPDAISVSFSGYSGQATGKLTYIKEGNVLHVTEGFHWSSDEPAEIELTGAQLWAPAFIKGTYTNGGIKASSSAILSSNQLSFPQAPAANVSMENRSFSNFLSPAGSLESTTFNAVWGSLQIVPKTLNADSNWTLFDGRNYPQGWADGKSLFWFGQLGIPISKDHPVTTSFDIIINPNVAFNNIKVQENTSSSLTLMAIPNVENPVNEKLPLVPYPKQIALSESKGLEITGKWKFPAGQFFHWSEFTDALSRRFVLPIPPKNATPIAVDGGSADINAPHQGYQITVEPGHVTVLGRDEMGLRFGLYRLAEMVYSKNGHLYLPYGVLTDWPSDNWRGFHLFSGPKSLEFQTKLFDRVLGPMFFNQAVIECERTQWDATPNQRGDEYMTKAQLLRLFDMYRKQGIEPIPLIESFGHMSWLFTNGANLDIAENPKVPYGVDPRIPRTAVFLNDLWQEAIELLKPKMVHFGCDEVAMRGYPNDGELLTTLWPLQMKILGDIAKKENVGMMIWGDECLAPSEAIDAANAPDLAQAAKRREAIPAGAYIADWHYKADSNLSHFEPSLETWKSGGFTPIASTWYQPQNIQGFTSAAVQEKVGTLQTTWSGVYSDESNPLNDFDQFAAFILSAEYSWSGRQDPPSQLGYDYRELFWQLFYERPIPLAPIAGYTAKLNGENTNLVQDGRFTFDSWKPIEFFSAIDPTRVSQPKSMDFKVSVKGKLLVLNADTLMPQNVGDEVGTITIKYADNTKQVDKLTYGWNIRAKSDGQIAPLAERGTAYDIYLNLDSAKQIKEIDIQESSSVAGLSVYGMSFEN